jgi:hypothetical protein
MIFTSF